MDLSFFLIIAALAIGFFTLLRKLRFNPESKENNSSSPPTSLSLSCATSPSASSSSLSLSSPPSPPSSQSSLTRNWDHNVFPSFHGPDVREKFLSHMLKEFRKNGIEPFIDNDIERSKSIGSELKRAIRGSKIAIVLLSKNYASSSWCLDELVEIMKCREDLGQTVMTIFYEVDPTDVKKQTEDFGKTFKKTCQGKSSEKIDTWRKALEDVATIAGYHSKNCDNEAAMIEEISANVSKMLNQLIPSCDFERYIGMGAHIEKMKPLLRMDSDEVGIIGIWGPPGIGKTTMARFLFNKLSNSFQLSVFMENIKVNYPRPCLDEYSAKLQLQNQMLCQVLNKKDMVITHLRTAPERLKEKKVLLVLDDVDQVAQLEALAEDIQWFGRGSRIIIITEDIRVLRAHRVNDIYTVDLPSDDEALEIFCFYAFGQKYPKDGFRKLAWEIVCHVGKLPLGLKVMGSYFRNMSKQEWKKALPKLWSSLDGKIESILKFSYDTLDYDDKYLFLHIACFFVGEETELVKEFLEKKFLYVSHGLDVLVEKSLIYAEKSRKNRDGKQVKMHDLLVKLGREIVRKQSKDPGKRQFLVDDEEISEILEDDGAGSENVIGIKFHALSSQLNISERAFEGMSNLQFLKIERGDSLQLPHGLSYLSSKLRLLHWDSSPMTCFPSNVNMKFLVDLNMRWSKLEKLWEGIKRLPSLKWMDLSYSENLKEIPDLSTATNLQELILSGCSSLVELPSSIGNATNLQKLDLSECSSLVELPTSIGNLHKLRNLKMKGCSKLEILPVNVNLNSLDVLDLSDCLSLKSFPEISTNIWLLILSRTAIEMPSSIRSWSCLESLDMSGCKNLKKFAHGLDSITERDTKIQDVSPLVQEFPRLRRLTLKGCKELLSLPQLPDSLELVDAENCESLKRLEYSSLRCTYINLNFRNCFKLNQAARDLIIQTSTCKVTVLPGEEIPTYFSHRADGRFITLKLNERSFPSSLMFKVCVLLVRKNDLEDSSLKVHCSDIEDSDEERSIRNASCGDDESIESGNSDGDRIKYVQCGITDKQSNTNVQCYGRKRRIYSPLTDHHLYIFQFDADVTSKELLFKFILCDLSTIIRDGWVIKECGVHYENCEAGEEVNEGGSLDEEGDIEGYNSLDEDEENEGDSAETTKMKMVRQEFPLDSYLQDQMETIDTISKYTSDSEAGCSKPKVVDYFTEMGFDEEKVIKAIHEHGEENMEQIANVRLSSEVGINGEQ